MPALSPVSKINLDNYRFVRTIETGGFGEWAAFALSDVVWTILFAWIASSDRALVRPATVCLMTCSCARFAGSVALYETDGDEEDVCVKIMKRSAINGTREVGGELKSGL